MQDILIYYCPRLKIQVEQNSQLTSSQPLHSCVVEDLLLNCHSLGYNKAWLCSFRVPLKLLLEISWCISSFRKLILLQHFCSYVCDEVSKKVRHVYLILPISFDWRCRHIDGILMCYEKIYKSINVDQPKADVFSQGESGFV